MWLGKVKLLCCVLWFHQTVVCSLIIICGFLCHWFFPFLLRLKKARYSVQCFLTLLLYQWSLLVNCDHFLVLIVNPWSDVDQFVHTVFLDIIPLETHHCHLTYVSGSVPRFKQTCLKYHCHCFCSVNATVILSFGDYFACLYYLLFYNNNNNNLL